MTDKDLSYLRVAFNGFVTFGIKMGVLPFKRLVYTVFIVSATINLANGASHSGLVTQYYSERKFWITLSNSERTFGSL